MRQSSVRMGNNAERSGDVMRFRLADGNLESISSSFPSRLNRPRDTPAFQIAFTAELSRQPTEANP
jgi:hypothetical protein